MWHGWLTLILMAASPATAPTAPECEIAGLAIHWAYDACFFEHETDDELHPGVIACADRYRQRIAEIGECAARREVKETICRRTIAQFQPELDLQSCLAGDQVVGATVRNGGI